MHDHRVLVEPACGASLSVLYSKQRRSVPKVPASNAVQVSEHGPAVDFIEAAAAT